jgi:predicted Zn-dependent peptidase
LGQILGQGKTSILYQHLTKKQLALQASAYSSLSELAGEFTFDMIPTQGKRWQTSSNCSVLRLTRLKSVACWMKTLPSSKALLSLV